ncbi:beta-N-acetylhexosaminidase [Bacillus timonensis]|nr:beta-N-acetylhexosaminidase [Bacillus timonensis]
MRKISLLTLALLLVFLSSCSRDPGGESLTERLKKMSLEEKIGQMLLVGVDGHEVDEETARLLRSYHIGGVVLFQRNIKNTEQLTTFLNELKEENASSGNVPLFLAVDEEGGRVSRLPNEFYQLPANEKIGRMRDEDFSFKVGRVLAKEIKSVGFNMNFAPVLDVNTNPRNPVIGDRSYGKNPKLVSQLGIQTMKGMQSEEVISVIKHFPGHGDTSVDSHKELPILRHDLNRLKRVELIPFVEAIDKGADMVMSAHLFLPKIDSSAPATLSKKIMTDLLRTELRFEGVAITDDLTMRAISRKYSIEEAAVKAIQAGNDIVLIANGPANIELAIQAILDAVKKGEITEDRIDQSLHRILSLKQKYKLADKPVNPVNVQELNREIEELLD